MTVTITVGVNSWLTLAEAETYFASRINSTPWTSLASDDEKSKYLISAYNWIFYDPAFSAPASSALVAVKNGQCEAALFLITYASDFAEREAKIASGIKSFSYSKWSENLSEVKKPTSVSNYFSSAGFYLGSNGCAQLQDFDALY